MKTALSLSLSFWVTAVVAIWFGVSFVGAAACGFFVVSVFFLLEFLRKPDPAQDADTPEEAEDSEE